MKSKDYSDTQLGFGFNNSTNMNANRQTKNITYDIGLFRVQQDVKRWRDALLFAENRHYPNRTEYYRTCKDVALDNHLSSCITQRKNAVLCRDLQLVDKNGIVNEEKTKLLTKDWFYRLLDHSLDSRYYGFSLLDLGPLIDDSFPFITIVPRQYVRPELNIVVPTTGGFTGVQIDDPKYINWNIFIGDHFDLGLLVKAGPVVINKKAAMGFWAEYCEKFGMPIRIGKTQVQDDVLKSNMEQALKNMGKGFYGMIGIDDSIELLSSGQKGAEAVYNELIKTNNSELSKLILGQTGTTDEKSFVGSAEIHQGVANNIVESDITWLTNVLNEKVKDVLNFHGFGLEEFSFEFQYNESLSITEKSKIDAAFAPYLNLSGLKFDKKYLEETYGMKLEEAEIEEAAVPVKKKPLANHQRVAQWYNSSCTICGGIKEYSNDKDDFEKPAKDPFTEKEKETFLEAVWLGEATVHHLPVFVYEKTVKNLEDALLDGFGTEKTEASLYNELRTNIYKFSAAKTYQQVRDVHEILVKYHERKDIFLKKAGQLFDDYNKTWLNTEFDTALSSGIGARNWKKIEAQKNALPFLEYHTVGDSRVRPTHAALDGITRKVGDSFWDTYYPPNGWECRCTVLQHADVAQVTDLTHFKAPDDVPDIFKGNVGKDGIVFSEDHPYFKVARGDKDWKRRNFGLPLP